MKYSKENARKRRKVRIRKKINGTPSRPRLVVYRSNLNIYAQLINDLTGETLCSSSTLSLKKSEGKLSANRETAAKVGKDLALKAKDLNIESVVFDRNGYLYHGRIKALADGAREAGLKF